jgi:HK97 family phage prohead protease/HK97 family phage major capsid protein
MPIPTPNDDESESDFMGRCMGNQTMMDDFPSQDQRLAVCGTAWRQSQKDAGQKWVKDFAAPPPGSDPLEYTMSDGSIDRMGDVIEQSGWKLDNFRRNPVALFGHNASFPIGKWSEVVIRDDKLIGRLSLINPVSDRMREIHAAVDAGVLRAVSVGFHANKHQPLEGSKDGGLHFLEQELVECSLVSVPANPNALATVRALGISREGEQLIFGGIADVDRLLISRDPNGGLAKTNHFIRKPTKMNLSERIESARSNMVTLQDQLNSNIDAGDLDNLDELTNQVEETRKQIATWERAERALGNASETITLPRTQYSSNVAVSQPAASSAPKVWMPKKQEEPGNLFIRHCVAKLIAHVRHSSVDEAMRERYGHYADFEQTRGVHDYYMRAATAPATTTTTGWAAELATTMYGDFFESLSPGSIYGPLAPQGFRVTLGRNATITMPTDAATPTVAGSFVLEGAPIPVRQAAFTPVSMGLKKMAVIVAYTREIGDHSNPAIEAVIRRLITKHTMKAIDTVLIDAVAVSTARPAGIRNGVSVTAATAGGGFNALVTDIKNLIGVLAAVDSLRSPIFIMNPVQKVAITFAQGQAGTDFPLASQINNNTLAGYPVIVSSTVPAGMVILIDAADFMSATGDDPRFDVSDQATLHFEDTTPLQIGTVGAPATVAAPSRSMYQTDSIALRMILPMNWMMLRSGVIAWTQAVTW